MNIEYLRWDTENFGFKVGRVESSNGFDIDSLHLEMSKGQYKLVYLISDLKIEGLNLFYDTKLVYNRRNIQPEFKNCKCVKSIKGEPLTDKLVQLAITSGSFSRYHIDKQFPDHKFEMLYSLWLKNSLYTDYATDVLAYFKEEEPVGILTYKIDKSKATIGIISVDSHFRGLGIGSKLMNSFISKLPKSIKDIDVVTQGINISACHYYEKNGFKISYKRYLYHVWSE